MKDEDKVITKKEVEHIAWLARIKLTKKEKEKFTNQFNDILEFFKQIDKVDTEKVQPTFHVIDLVNVFREDKVEESLSLEEILQNAPKTHEKKLFRAPKMA